MPVPLSIHFRPASLDLLPGEAAQPPLRLLERSGRRAGPPGVRAGSPAPTPEMHSRMGAWWQRALRTLVPGGWAA